MGYQEFECRNPHGRRPYEQQWIGKAEGRRISRTITELDIRGRGSHMYTIVGKHSYGYFLCIPGWGIGCELSAPGDVFWNKEQLMKYLSETDAITISQAIKNCIV